MHYLPVRQMSEAPFRVLYVFEDCFYSDTWDPLRKSRIVCLREWLCVSLNALQKCDFIRKSYNQLISSCDRFLTSNVTVNTHDFYIGAVLWLIRDKHIFLCCSTFLEWFHVVSVFLCNRAGMFPIRTNPFIYPHVFICGIVLNRYHHQQVHYFVDGNYVQWSDSNDPEGHRGLIYTMWYYALGYHWSDIAYGYIEKYSASSSTFHVMLIKQGYSLSPGTLYIQKIHYFPVHT